MNTDDKWYVSSTGNHQGLIVDEATGKNIAVTYDKQHAPLVAAAPQLLTRLQELVTAYEEYRDQRPTGHLWPDPNVIYHAKQAIAEATSGAVKEPA